MSEISRVRPIPSTRQFNLAQQRFVQLAAGGTLFFLILNLWLSLVSATPDPNRASLLLTQFALVVANGWLLWLSATNWGTARLLLMVLFVVIIVFTDSFVATDALFVLSLFALTSIAPIWLVGLALAYLLILSAYLLIPPNGAPETTPLDIVNNYSTIIAIALTAVAFRLFVNSETRIVRNLQRSADLLGANADIGQITSRLLNVNEVLNNAVELIRQRFGYYHVQVFLINETREQAILIASTGEVGRRLLARKHQLTVGSQSVIGQVTLRGVPIVSSDSDRAAVHARNELLPNTRSELALPLLDGETIIGALDVQSTDPDAFKSEDIRALQVSANLLTTAIRNARLFEQQERVVRENEALLAAAQGSLREIERLNQQLTGASWQQYLGQAPVVGVSADASGIAPASTWTDALIAAAARAQPVAAQDAAAHVIAVPLTLRGQVIGAVEIEADHSLSASEQLDALQAIAQRLAVSLENARLFEEAQMATAQEQRINDIVSRYQAVNNVDELLRITLLELSDVFNARQGSIRLGRVRYNADAPISEPGQSHSTSNGSSDSNGHHVN